MLQKKANSAVWGPYFCSYFCLVCGWGCKKNPHLKCPRDSLKFPLGCLCDFSSGPWGAWQLLIPEGCAPPHVRRVPKVASRPSLRHCAPAQCNSLVGAPPTQVRHLCSHAWGGGGGSDLAVVRKKKTKKNNRNMNGRRTKRRRRRRRRRRRKTKKKTKKKKNKKEDEEQQQEHEPKKKKKKKKKKEKKRRRIGCMPKRLFNNTRF